MSVMIELSLLITLIKKHGRWACWGLLRAKSQKNIIARFLSSRKLITASPGADVLYRHLISQLCLTLYAIFWKNTAGIRRHAVLRSKIWMIQRQRSSFSSQELRNIA